MADENKFQIGDQVQLLSGGPVLIVVEDGRPSGEYGCAWFAKDDTLQKAFLPSMVLRKADEDRGPRVWSV